MTYVTQQAFEQVLQHGQAVKQHGKEFERLAKSLLDEHLLNTDQAAFLKSRGQQIQQRGQIMTVLAEEALQKEQYLIADYFLAHQQYRQAILLYIQAVKVIVLLIMKTLIFIEPPL